MKINIYRLARCSIGNLQSDCSRYYRKPFNCNLTIRDSKTFILFKGDHYCCYWFFFYYLDFILMYLPMISFIWSLDGDIESDPWCCYCQLVLCHTHPLPLNRQLQQTGSLQGDWISMRRKYARLHTKEF